MTDDRRPKAEAPKGHFCRRLDRLEGQYEQMAGQAADRERTLARLRSARGWVGTVHTQDDWESPTSAVADVALHLLGVRVPPVSPGQVSLLRLISHPDRLTARRCETYDAVFAASDSFRDDLVERIATPVHAPHRLAQVIAHGTLRP